MGLKTLNTSRRELIKNISSAAIATPIALQLSLFGKPQNTTHIKVSVSPFFNAAYFEKFLKNVLSLANSHSDANHIKFNYVKNPNEADIVLTSPSFHRLPNAFAFIGRAPGGLPAPDMIRWIKSKEAQQIWNQTYQQFNVKPFLLAIETCQRWQPFSLEYLSSNNSKKFTLSGAYSTNPHFVSKNIEFSSCPNGIQNAKQQILSGHSLTTASIHQNLLKNNFDSESVFLKTDGLRHSPQIFQLSFNLTSWKKLTDLQQSEFESVLQRLQPYAQSELNKTLTKFTSPLKVSFQEEIDAVTKFLIDYQSNQISKQYLPISASIEKYINFRKIETKILEQYLLNIADISNLHSLLAKYNSFRSSSNTHHLISA